MSGGQKRANPHLQESISLIRAMQVTLTTALALALALS